MGGSTNVAVMREANGLTFDAAKRKLRGINLARVERSGTDYDYIARRIAKVTGVPFAAYLRPIVIPGAGTDHAQK